MAVIEVGMAGSPDEMFPSEGAVERPDQLHIDAERVGSTVLLTLHGSLEAEAKAPLVDAVDEVLVEGSCRDLIISCAGIGSIDPSGIRALVAVRAACAGHDMVVRLIDTDPALDRLLDGAGLRRAF
jgi:anti-anti-sigma factor